MDGGCQNCDQKLNDAGYLVFIVTNQAGIARGYYDEAAVNKLHHWMQSELAIVGAHFDDVRFCPHHPQGTVAELSHDCECRKPNPGMLKALIERWNPEISASIMLGDSTKDVDAGVAMGIFSKKIPPLTILQEVEQLLESRHQPE